MATLNAPTTMGGGTHIHMHISAGINIIMSTCTSINRITGMAHVNPLAVLIIQKPIVLTQNPPQGVILGIVIPTTFLMHTLTIL